MSLTGARGYMLGIDVGRVAGASLKPARIPDLLHLADYFIGKCLTACWVESFGWVAIMRLEMMFFSRKQQVETSSAELLREKDIKLYRCLKEQCNCLRKLIMG
jgi:hypothetical protein